MSTRMGTRINAKYFAHALKTVPTFFTTPPPAAPQHICVLAWKARSQPRARSRWRLCVCVWCDSRHARATATVVQILSTCAATTRCEQQSVLAPAARPSHDFSAPRFRAPVQDRYRQLRPPRGLPCAASRKQMALNRVSSADPCAALRTRAATRLPSARRASSLSRFTRSHKLGVRPVHRRSQSACCTTRASAVESTPASARWRAACAARAVEKVGTTTHASAAGCMRALAGVRAIVLTFHSRRAHVSACTHARTDAHRRREK
eukprot:IDg19371t1